MINIVKILKNNSGFGLIEIITSAAVIAIVFITVSGFILFSRDATLKAQRNTEAVSLAEEAIEVVRKLRDDGWTTNITPLTSGTVYYPTISGNAWTLSTTNPSPTSYYQRSLVISNVSRDGNQNIVTAGGTNDPNTKKVEATVTWNDSGTKNVKITTYITNFRSD